MIISMISAVIALKISIKAVDYPPLPFKMPKQFNLVSMSHTDAWIAGLYVIMLDYKTSLSRIGAYTLLRQKTHAIPVPSKHGECDLKQATTGMSLYYSVAPNQSKDSVHVLIWLYPYTFEPGPKIWWKGAICKTPPYGSLVAPFDEEIVATSASLTEAFKPTGIRNGYVFTAQIPGKVQNALPRFDKVLTQLKYTKVASLTHEVEYRSNYSKVYKIGLGSGKSRPGPLGKDNVFVSWFVEKQTSNLNKH